MESPFKKKYTSVNPLWLKFYNKTDPLKVQSCTNQVSGRSESQHLFYNQRKSTFILS